MIFVTVGLHYQGFDRLIRKMDEIAGKIDEEVIMQVGSTKYRPVHAKYFESNDDEGMTELFMAARITVTQAGSGTLLDLIRLKRPFILVPRLKKFSEHIDDQQIELAQALSESSHVVSIYDINELEDAITNFRPVQVSGNEKNQDIVQFLKNAIDGFQLNTAGGKDLTENNR